MGKQVGIVVGIDIDKQSKSKSYRVIAADITPKKEKGQYQWAFSCTMMQEQQIVQGLSAGQPWLNVRLSKSGRPALEGSSGSLGRFNDGPNKPYVIISRLVNSDKKTLGYKIASYEGAVKNISLKEIISYGLRVTKHSGVPIQNAIFVCDNGKTPFYKAYPGKEFLTEVIVVNKRNESAQKPAAVQVKKNSETLRKLEDIYTPAQIAELKLGKEHGVDIRIYANPELSDKQMHVLREGLEKKLNVKLFASPEYSVQHMKWYSNDLKAGIDIRQYLNPNYDLGQLFEISLAADQGLDISKLANIKRSANDMAEMRERMERNIWKDELVKKDGSWV